LRQLRKSYIYLLALRLDRHIFMGTTAWFFLALNLFKVPFSYALGLINPASLATSLVLIPFAVGGALSGRLLLNYLNQTLFETLVLLLTFVAGIRLLIV
jgi:uncharacterized protein